MWSEIRKPIFVICVFVCFAAVASAQITTGTFTYQGRLMYQGSPAAASGDFQVAIYDAQTGGNQSGTTQTFTSVAIDDGLFALDLEMVLPENNEAPERWLEIGVRQSGTPGAYIALNPRQRVQPTPMALAAYTGLAPFDVTASETASKNAAIIGRADWTQGVGVKGFGMGADESSRLGGYYEAGGEFIGRNGVWAQALDTEFDGYGVAGFAAGSQGTGVYGRATADGNLNYGVYGRSDSSAGLGGFFYNSTGDALEAWSSIGGVAIKASGSGVIKSTAETRVSVSPSSVVYNGTGVTLIHRTSGGIELNADSGSVYLYFPIQAAAVLYGAEMKISGLEIVYETRPDASGSAPGITTVVLRDSDGDGTYTEAVYDSTGRSETTWSTISLSPATPHVVQGTLNLMLYVSTPTASDVVAIEEITLIFTQ